MATTKHSCGGPVFGRKTPGCARCDELLAGAAPIVWAGTERYACIKCGRITDCAGMCSTCESKAHHTSDRHNNPAHPHYCGRVCTFGDW